MIFKKAFFIEHLWWLFLKFIIFHDQIEYAEIAEIARYAKVFNHAISPGKGHLGLKNYLKRF